MYLCFDDDDKRSAFAEAALISIDENGFTLKSSQNSRTGNSVFLKQRAFKGAVQNFSQALSWVRTGSPKKAAASGGENLPDNPSF